MFIFIVGACFGICLGFIAFAIISVGSEADKRDKILQLINKEREKKC